MNIAEIITTAISVVTLAAAAAWRVVKLHSQKHEEKHSEHDRRITNLENSSIASQKAISEIDKGVAVLLERTKHMGHEHST